MSFMACMDSYDISVCGRGKQSCERDTGAACPTAPGLIRIA